MALLASAPPKGVPEESVRYSSVPASFDSFAAPHAAPARAQLKQAYAELPIRFERNEGQTDSRVKFLSRGPGYTLFLTQNEAVLSMLKPQRASAISKSGLLARGTDERRQADVVRLRLAGANSSSDVVGSAALASTSNYFLGNDPGNWRTNVPNYGVVQFRGVYRGVDAVFHGNQGSVEYDFDVAPGADPGQIQIEIQGAADISVDSNGDAILGIRDGQKLAIKKPVIYQKIGGRRRQVAGGYRLHDGNLLAFAVGDYDHSRPLVIDPTLTYSTYFGGTNVDEAQAIAVYTPSGGSPMAFITGFTESPNFPTAGTGGNSPYQSVCPQSCNVNAVAFVAEMATSLSGASSLVYSTYLGPESGPEYTFTDAVGIAVDSAGEAVVVGNTGSADFPITTGSAPSFSQSSGFVTKLNSTGSNLVYSSYRSGTGTDQATGVALDSSGNAYVVGATSSPSLATSGVFQERGLANALDSTGGSFNGFIAKIPSSGPPLTFYAYLGGSGAYGDGLTAVALDSSGNAYVTGQTASSDFPVTSGAYQNTYASYGTNNTYDALFAEISADGSTLLYSSYLSGKANSSSIGEAIAVASLSGTNYAYITGFSGSATSTTGEPFPTTSGVVGQASSACNETPSMNFCPSMFAARFNPAASGANSLVYSTYLGGLNTAAAGGDSAYGIAVDSSGDAFITGAANDGVDVAAGTNVFPVNNVTIGPAPIQANPACPTTGGFCIATQAFLIELNQTATSVIYSTYLGNTGSGTGSIMTPTTQANGIALDNAATPNIYLAGYTSAGGMQVTSSNAYQSSSSSTGNTGFLAEISQSGSPAGLTYSTALLSFGNVPVSGMSQPQSVTVTNVSSSPIVVDNPLQPGNGFQIASSSCNGTAVASNSNCVITVVFAPTSAGAAPQTTLVIDSADTSSPFSVSLTGTGVTTASTVTPNPLAFGNVLAKNPTVLSVTLTNTGIAALTSIAASVSGTDMSDFTLAPAGTCGTTLNPAAMCTINVTFTPTAAGGGNETASLQISYAGGMQTVTLTGTGVPFSLGTVSNLNSTTSGTTTTITASVMVSIASGFSGTLNLSCATVAQALLSDGATCSVVPSSVSLTGSPLQSVTVMITVTIPNSGLYGRFRPHVPPNGLWMPVSLSLAMLLLCLWIMAAAPRRPLVRPGVVLLSAVLLCSAWVASCTSSGSGSTSGSTSNSSGTTSTTGGGSSTTTSVTPGQYTYVVTGTLGSLTQSVNVVVNVP